MDPRLLGLYEQELRYFRESSGEFARAYPKIAARLGLDGPEVDDPYVERLIEASAFLSARVLLKLDAEYPRFASQLLGIVHPHFTAPTPAMLVAECQPAADAGALVSGPLLPRNSALRVRRPLGQNTHCEFRTAQDLRLWPLELVEASCFTHAPDVPVGRHPNASAVRGGLRLRLQTRGGVPFSELALDDLLLYVGGGGDDVGWPLLECLLAEPPGVLVCVPDGRAGVQMVAALDGQAVEPVGFADEQAMLPRTLAGFSGFRLVQEYFAFAPRFQFVRLRGLQQAVRQVQGTELELVLLFSRHRPELEKLVGSEHVRLHCVPAVNLFSKRLDRVVVHEGASEFHLLPDRTRPQDFEVHSVTEVVGYLANERAGRRHGGGSSRSRTQPFLPFYAAFHGSRGEQPAYYTIAREPRRLSERQRSEGHRSSHIGSEVYIQLVDPGQAPYADALRQLSVTALCTNRDLPLMLATGSDTLDVDAAAISEVRILRGPSRPFTPVVVGGLGWRVVDHLALNYLSLTDSSAEEGAQALREMLLLYAGGADESRTTQIRGLLSVSTQAITRRLPLPGPIAFGRGLEITLTIDPGAFHGHSAFLFGAVLAQYLARHVEVNHFVETVLRTSSGTEVMRWRPQCGTRPIL